MSVPDSDFNWTGFFRPIENIDADGNYVLNLVKAGQGVPVKFSLAGDQGPGHLRRGLPEVQPDRVRHRCGGQRRNETVIAGGGSLSYDVFTDTYSYIWKTDKSWGGTCRQLDVELVDGSTHSAQFQFK